MPKSTLILLALDDPQTLALFERILEATAYTTVLAHDQTNLNKILQEASPALVILSEKLNRVDSLGIAGTLLERFPTLPILIFLNQESPAFVRKAIHLGVSDCLCPPLKTENILEAIENSLKRANRIGDMSRREVRRSTATLEQKITELEKLEKVLNTIEDGVIILDQDQRVLLLNPVVRRIFGLTNVDFRGRPVLTLIPHHDLRSLLSMGESDPLPFHEILFDDGRVYNAQYTLISEIGSVVTIQDITYLKQIDRLKSEFVHTVSHDLRSPLTAILGYVELLERIGPLNDQQREFVKRVQASVQNITTLVNDLLDLGRIEAGFDVQKEVIPVDGILNYTLEHLRQQIIEKNLNLQVEYPSKIPSLRGNPIRLRQMLDNLIGNAIKYTPAGGRITIGLEKQGEQAILRISDTGPGIPPSDQLHIFDKFYRASNVPKGIGGSGLGLAIVKSIVDNHQGRIWVESVLGEGTTFTLVLPIYMEVDSKPA